MTDKVVKLISKTADPEEEMTNLLKRYGDLHKSSYIYVDPRDPKWAEVEQLFAKIMQQPLVSGSLAHLAWQLLMKAIKQEADLIQAIPIRGRNDLKEALIDNECERMRDDLRRAFGLEAWDE